MQTEQRSASTTKPDKEHIFSLKLINVMAADLMIRICTYMLVAIVPIYVIERGFSTQIAGLTTSLYMITGVLFRPFSGNLVDTKGRYIVMLIGSAVYCFATGLYLLAIPVWMLLVIRVLQGFGWCLNGTALMTLATDLIPESRMSEGIGYMGLMQTMAQATAPGIVLAIKNAYGYHAAFIVIFVFALLNFLSRFSLKSIDKKNGLYKESAAELNKGSVPNVSKDNVPFFERIVEKDAFRPALIMLFVMLSTTSVNTFLVAYAAQRGIINPGVFFTANAVMIAVARLVVGRIHQKFGYAAIIAPSLLLIILSLVGISFSTSIPMLLVSGLVYGLGRGAIQPEVNSMVVLAAKKESRGLANSTLFMLMDLGNAVGAFVLGTVANYTGIGTIYGIGAGILVFTLIAFVILHNNGFFNAKEYASE